MGEVARRLGLGKGGRPVHPSTPSRWAVEGVRMADGSRLHLEHVTMPGGRLVTSWPAVLRFLAAQSRRPATAGGSPPPRGPGHRRRASKAADRELERHGC